MYNICPRAHIVWGDTFLGVKGPHTCSAGRRGGGVTLGHWRVCYGKIKSFQGQKRASGREGLPCPCGHPSFGTSKQLTCFGCSGILCKMTSLKKKTAEKTQPHGFRISGWALNICKNSDTQLPHRVGFRGSEGLMWPGEGGEWPSPSQENGPSPPSFSGTAYVSRCPVTKEDSAGLAHSENTTC